MNLEEFYKRYIFHKKRKEYSHLTKKEKDELSIIYRMWEKGLIHLEGIDSNDNNRS